jgi:UDP-N-acetylmuramoyl-L-alanyl-D-glutamate--2,6-diaminopimelate ligase
MANHAHTTITEVLAKFTIEVPSAYHAKLESCQAIKNDTRSLVANDIFCAIIGNQCDGRDYIDQAILQGAILILSECELAKNHGAISQRRSGENSALVIEFYQLNQKLFSLCQYYYQQPQKDMTIIGITGTNGKTSLCQLVARLLEAHKQSCAILGTLGAGRVDKLIPLNNTTPGATELHHYINEFKAQGIKNVAMEVSSHALEQARIVAEFIDIAVFTNLSRDHLDYHKSMAAYAAAKAKIFSHNASQIAILNVDDQQAQQWLTQWPVQQHIIAYGNMFNTKQYNTFVSAKNIKHHHSGVSFTLVTHLGESIVNSPLLGRFNIDNLLGAIAILIAKKIEFSAICHALKCIKPVAGRMETFSGKNKATAVVDYAHTPDALANALIACRDHCTGELWVVFGCGGNRDQGKRSLMGRIAEQNADHVVITNDNPRDEPPEVIANDILRGCAQPAKVMVILDRQEAVLSTLTKAKANDIVLLAGKGHEDYIIIGNQHLNYNERAIVQNFYQPHEQQNEVPL